MATDYNKKTVAELQEILKSRSLSYNGKKAELVARLNKDDEDKAKAEPAATTTDSGKADTADDVIDWDDDAAVEEPTAGKISSEAGAATLAAGGKGAVNNPVSVPNQELGENPATNDDLKVESVGAVPSEKPESAEVETAKAEEKPAVDYTKGLPISEMEEELKKRKARAEKFGIVEDSQTALSEAEKQLQRAKRFGTGATEGAAAIGVKGLDEALPEGRLRKRNRNDNDQGGRGGKRRDFGRNRNRRRGNNRNGNGNRNDQNVGKSSGQPAWSEKDSLAMEARKKRFATAA